MSSESIPGPLFSKKKKRKWLDGRKKKKVSGLTQSDLLKTGAALPQNTGDIKYSENWKSLSQVLQWDDGCTVLGPCWIPGTGC